MSDTRIVAYTLVIHRPTGRILTLTRAADDSYRPGKPDIPGGKVDPGEPLFVGAARELREEAGITVALQDLEPLHAHTAYEVHDHKGKVNWIDVMFVTYVDDDTVRLSHEHSAYAWVAPGELARLLGHDAHVRAWAYIEKHNLLAASPKTRLQAAKLLLRDEVGAVLWLRRSKTHPYWALCDDIPGGRMEPSEQPEDTVTRELSEETALALDPTSLQLVHAATAYVSERQRSETRFTYVARQTGEHSPTLSYEHDQYEWRAPAMFQPNLDHPDWNAAVAHARIIGSL